MSINREEEAHLLRLISHYLTTGKSVSISLSFSFTLRSNEMPVIVVDSFVRWVSSFTLFFQPCETSIDDQFVLFLLLFPILCYVIHRPFIMKRFDHRQYRLGHHCF